MTNAERDQLFEVVFSGGPLIGDRLQRERAWWDPRSARDGAHSGRRLIPVDGLGAPVRA